MGKTVTELVYLKFKPGVKPEDPENSEEGKRFLDVVNEVKNSRGYQGASWGRTAEDQNSVVWAIGEFTMHPPCCPKLLHAVGIYLLNLPTYPHLYIHGPGWVGNFYDFWYPFCHIQLPKNPPSPLKTSQEQYHNHEFNGHRLTTTQNEPLMLKTTQTGMTAHTASVWIHP